MAHLFNLFLLLVPLSSAFIINEKHVNEDGVKVFTVSSEIKHNNCSCACNCLDEQVPSGKLLEAPNTPNSNAPKQFIIKKIIRNNDCYCACSCVPNGQVQADKQVQSVISRQPDEAKNGILNELKTTIEESIALTTKPMSTNRPHSTTVRNDIQVEVSPIYKSVETVRNTPESTTTTYTTYGYRMTEAKIGQTTTVGYQTEPSSTTTTGYATGPPRYQTNSRPILPGNPFLSKNDPQTFATLFNTPLPTIQPSLTLPTLPTISWPFPTIVNPFAPQTTTQHPPSSINLNGGTGNSNQPSEEPSRTTTLWTSSSEHPNDNWSTNPWTTQNVSWTTQNASWTARNDHRQDVNGSRQITNVESTLPTETPRTFGPKTTLDSEPSTTINQNNSQTPYSQIFSETQITNRGSGNQQTSIWTKQPTEEKSFVSGLEISPGSFDSTFAQTVAITPVKLKSLLSTSPPWEIDGDSSFSSKQTTSLMVKSPTTAHIVAESNDQPATTIHQENDTRTATISSEFKEKVQILLERLKGQLHKMKEEEGSGVKPEQNEERLAKMRTDLQQILKDNAANETLSSTNLDEETKASDRKELMHKLDAIRKMLDKMKSVTTTFGPSTIQASTTAATSISSTVSSSPDTTTAATSISSTEHTSPETTTTIQANIVESIMSSMANKKKTQKHRELFKQLHKKLMELKSALEDMRRKGSTTSAPIDSNASFVVKEPDLLDFDNINTQLANIKNTLASSENAIKIEDSGEGGMKTEEMKETLNHLKQALNKLQSEQTGEEAKATIHAVETSTPSAQNKESTTPLPEAKTDSSTIPDETGKQPKISIDFDNESILESLMPETVTFPQSISAKVHTEDKVSLETVSSTIGAPPSTNKTEKEMSLVPIQRADNSSVISPEKIGGQTSTTEKAHAGIASLLTITDDAGLTTKGVSKVASTTSTIKHATGGNGQETGVSTSTFEVMQSSNTTQPSYSTTTIKQMLPEAETKESITEQPSTVSREETTTIISQVTTSVSESTGPVFIQQVDESEEEVVLDKLPASTTQQIPETTPAYSSSTKNSTLPLATKVVKKLKFQETSSADIHPEKQTSDEEDIDTDQFESSHQGLEITRVFYPSQSAKQSAPSSNQNNKQQGLFTNRASGSSTPRIAISIKTTTRKPVSIESDQQNSKTIEEEEDDNDSDDGEEVEESTDSLRTRQPLSIKDRIPQSNVSIKSVETTTIHWIHEAEQSREVQMARMNLIGTIVNSSTHLIENAIRAGVSNQVPLGAGPSIPSNVPLHTIIETPIQNSNIGQATGVENWIRKSPSKGLPSERLPNDRHLSSSSNTPSSSDTRLFSVIDHLMKVKPPEHIEVPRAKPIQRIHTTQHKTHHPKTFNQSKDAAISSGRQKSAKNSDEFYDDYENHDPQLKPDTPTRAPRIKEPMSKVENVLPDVRIEGKLPKLEEAFSVDAVPGVIVKGSEERLQTLSITTTPAISSLSIHSNNEDITRLEEARRLREKLEQSRLEEDAAGAGIRFQFDTERRHQIEVKLAKLAEAERTRRIMLERDQFNSHPKANPREKIHDNEVKRPPIAESRSVTALSSTTESPLTVPSHCQPVLKFVDVYKVDEPLGWIHENCERIKRLYPGTSCQQIEEIFAVCFKQQTV